MRRILIPSSLALTLLTASSASAHSETVSLSSSFLSGLLHPLTGLDHLLAMIAFGVWFALQSPEQKRSLPTAVIATLLIGFTIGLSGFSLPMIEGGILSSILVMGLLIATTTKLQSKIALPLVAGFTFFHGFAHGAELGSAIAVLFMVGFVLSCTAVLTAAIKLTHSIQIKLPLATRLIGVMITMTGLSLVVS